MELKFAIPQPTHYDSPGGAPSEITVSNPGEDGPRASRVLLTQATSFCGEEWTLQDRLRNMDSHTACYQFTKNKTGDLILCF